MGHSSCTLPSAPRVPLQGVAHMMPPSASLSRGSGLRELNRSSPLDALYEQLPAPAQPPLPQELFLPSHNSDRMQTMAGLAQARSSPLQHHPTAQPPS